ncbi:MAG: DNA-directed DNA polymerase I [Asgard group archaeon]|nr:DNA-directed DNA polymerase I [Asgard group archaeon]
MSKEQSSLESFFTQKKSSDEPPETKKEEKDFPKKPSEQDQKENDNHINDELDEIGDDEDIIFEGAPVERCPPDTPPCCLLQSVYEGKSGKAFLSLLDEHSNQLYGWYDSSGHDPYCLSDLSPNELQKIGPVKNFKKITGYEEIQLKNLLTDKEITMTKIKVTDPLAIAGRFDSLRERLPAAWEANIRYHQNYLYDKELIPGMFYQVKGGKLVPAFPKIDKKVEQEILQLFKDAPKEVKELIPVYLPSLLARIPHIKRAALDIEVFTESMNRIADPVKAEMRVISVSFVGNDGIKKVLVLKRKDVKLGTRPKELTKDVEVIFFDEEVDLLKETFRLMQEYPLIITFNGDNFDLPYLHNRARNLKIPSKEIPFITTRDSYRIRNSIHFDAYKFFNQAAIKVYAFGAKYNESSLDAITSALLDSHKIELKEEIGFTNCYDLAYYNYWDSKITLELTTFNDSITIRLIILLMRLTGMTFEDITRQAVSSWVRNWLFAEHRRRKYLIPMPQEIIASRGDSTTVAMIKGKSYKGAIVVDPNPGVHFDVTVLDFASLYPTIIKTWNLSYETMRCNHAECKDRKMVPDTEHWVCTKNKGLMSILIGFIRDIRVDWFKPKTKDKSLDETTRNFYDVIQAALKVVINASYGVFGAPHFPFYCPPLAEATTAIGRDSITKTIEKCKEIGVEVIYGDTDSVFLKKPTKEQINELIVWSDKVLHIDLGIDKNYRYLALSDRKKNYLGVYPDGNVDVKGLLGKKRNTPPFLRNLFREIVSILSKVNTIDDIVTAKQDIEAIVKDRYTKLKKRELALEDLVFRVQINKGLDKYVKTTPQHVKAAKILVEKTGAEIGAGDLISYVKTNETNGVLPVELADVSQIDVDKYLSQMDSTLTQVLDPLGISFDRIIGIRSLDDFF